MPAISQLVTNLVSSRMLDAVSGFNFWIATLAGGADYPTVPVFQLTGTNPQSLIVGSFDENQIDDAALFTDYPACVIRAPSGIANAERMTPTAYSGPVTVWVDLYSSIFKDQIVNSLSEKYHDLFLDAMIETFNRQDEFSNYQSGIGYNNDISWSRAPLQSGGYDYRQKQRFGLSFHLPMITER